MFLYIYITTHLLYKLNNDDVTKGKLSAMKHTPLGINDQKRKEKGPMDTTETKWWAVEIDLFNCLLVKLNILPE